ncbi:hypothetical protein QBC40DRAFT_316919 [Triangularia verruculosa]|uniref:Glycoprotease family protein n=1 Tax=Triangularia verruculosa TaxID=2587418 RepID=A0AAN6X820_9PEZI|nr:hypothetical protein QBC40DRAFT_316919 [Triangularia verruculosa]
MATPNMNNPWNSHHHPSSNLTGRTKEDWEEWEDDEVLTPMTAAPMEGPLVDIQTEPMPHGQPAQATAVSLTPRMSVHKVKRLKSRHRQKAQNAKAGIKLVTDMSKFRQQKQQQHIANQMRLNSANRESRTGKFVDAAALLALEGQQNGESSSTFGWLKRKPTKGKRVDRLVAEASPQVDLSPSAGPIMIGFEMPTDSDVVISPQTAVVETPVDLPPYFRHQPTTTPPSKQPVSAWSPDTEDDFSPRGLDGMILPQTAYVPAVPSIPQGYKAYEASPFSAGGFGVNNGARNRRDTTTTAIYVSDDDSDMDTPVTLFEEDGSPVANRKSYSATSRKRSNTGGSARSQGWWDQVTSPFVPTPATPRLPAVGEAAEPKGETEWWETKNTKMGLSPVLTRSKSSQPASANIETKPRQPPPRIIIQDFSPVESPLPAPTPPVPAWAPVSAPTPTSAPALAAAAPAPAPIMVPTAASTPVPEPAPITARTTVPQEETPTEKARILVEESRTPELPPPYSPPHRQNNVRYQAVVPPGHASATMFPPSPGPVPVGLSQTMTSQGAIGLQNVPLTPPPTQMRLPDRPMGSFLPANYLPNLAAERKRRRHEKEDYVARKVGRGCMPCCGALGKPGPEGRKRRRVCFGILAAVIAMTILGVVLGVVLSRRTVAEEIILSRFLNLTDFPPMPTGISTVIGTQSDASTVCIQPATLWSCSLPEEEADSVAPFNADQPSFIFQIQFDNNTRQLWNVTGQEPPRPTPIDFGTGRPLDELNRTLNPTNLTTRPVSIRSNGISLSTLLRRLLLTPRQTQSPPSSLNPSPSPAPPSFQDMFFLGNTTDGVTSPNKAGEPTPFYITILPSLNSTTAGPNLLTRRQAQNPISPPLNISSLLPPPLLAPDGTPAPATHLPFPHQQPLRLYDRDLPSERYSFYSYYNKTIYLSSVSPNNPPPSSDRNGGSPLTEANFVVTWLSVRYKVEIWTRKENSTKLVGKGFGGRESNRNETQPGTFPYPITVTLDTHGGIPGSKFVFGRGVDRKNQKIVLDDAKLFLNQMNNTGDLVNPGGFFNPSFGGMDGGTGGCKCEYTNFVGLNGLRSTG